MQREAAVVIDADRLDALIALLRERGYQVLGPVVRDGAIMPGPVTGVADLPGGFHDDQAPGHYRLLPGPDPELFGWAVGPGSWKASFFPPSEVVWRGSPSDDPDPTPRTAGRPVAVIGARPCELAALDVLDAVLADGPFPDPGYTARRDGTVVVTVECGAPASTCFCTSMGTGPGAGGAYDLALTELVDDRGHRFLARAGSDLGAELLSDVPVVEAEPEDLRRRQKVLAGAEARMGGRLDTEGLPELLARNLDHPRWAAVAERCLACGNCTMVCPTCFCSDVHDTTDLSGTVTRQRVWSSCFDLDHSYLHGGPVRKSTSSRYRQWMTHKLSTWWDQFGTSGCVGCGRCIAWCPVGIDITEEVAAIRGADGVSSRGPSPERRRP